MDIYGFASESAYGINSTGMFPMAFDELVVQNMDIQSRYNRLSEAQKEQLIFKYKDAKDDEERRSVMNALLPEEDAARAMCRDDEMEAMHSNEITYAKGRSDMNASAGAYEDDHKSRMKNPME